MVEDELSIRGLCPTSDKPHSFAAWNGTDCHGFTCRDCKKYWAWLPVESPDPEKKQWNLKEISK